MKLKKLMAAFLVVAMGASTLMGCGLKNNDPNTETTGSTGQGTETTSGGTDAKAFDGVTLTMLKDADSADTGLNAVLALAKEKLGITVEVENRVGGAEGDTIVKTRLASGDMSDLCLYNSGSLLAAIHPADYFIDISGEDFISRLDDTYKKTVTVDGITYGIPFSSSQAGAILYNKTIYQELGLSVPKTWDELIANCEAIKGAGKTALIGTFGDSWTSQLIFLGDNYNILAQDPSFATNFEAGTIKYATSPAGLRSFEKLAQLLPYYNGDYLAATYDDGTDMLANAEGAMWPMLTQALSNIYELYPDKIDDIGVFAIPGDDAANSGLTVWMPGSIYGNKNASNVEAVKAFMEFYVSDEALNAYAGAVLPDGPYCIKGYQLPENSYKAVKEDMQAYFDAGKTNVALEFLTPVKGANCPSICQAVGSGQMTAEEGAKAYDEDCRVQALQLGLNWK
ncbi:MAG TPA: carbohydrate ABC transporter substrate-binding protein [Clostridiales bacterium]|nr:carbohydrate ABC transporter substrate-binding protein [Clostridiales bacterium]